MKILLVGGGSGGSVSPLLAVAEIIKEKKPGSIFLFVGTSKGPEKLMAQQAGIKFTSIPSGKLRRYFSLKNFLAPIFVLIGFFRALRIIRDFKPRCVFGTGSFIQVPVMWAAWFLRIPCVIHQQDIVAGLANKLCQIPAKKITVTFEESLKDFNSGLGLFYKKFESKTVLTGNPFRQNLKKYSSEEARKFFGLKKGFPTLLVLGGGTGAEFLNKLVNESSPQLTKFVQIIHAAGLGKINKNFNKPKHKQFEFISNMAAAYAAADLVLCRAGMSTITELSALEKVSIIVPMPGTHQEYNALGLLKAGAALVVPQKRLTPELLVGMLRKMLFDMDLQKKFKKNIAKIMPKDSGEKIAEIIIKIAD